MQYIDKLREQLRKTESRIEAIMDNGQSYCISGSHSVTNPDLEKLCRRIYCLSSYNIDKIKPGFN
ncbi:hypothetical protein P0136_09155 [Lentisphaerota bacterium ZTH]|nr:hypothetical protein JYG24_13335 [Lentisphaerota bacterium]WET05530.1 hypothetical protein P0136_09155 [Lentisphaerota bacterium ZTH]